MSRGFAPLLVLLAAVAAGCGSQAPNATTTTTQPTTTTTPSKPSDPRSIRANELGSIPVLMFHRVVQGGGEYDLTPKDFRRQLQLLSDSGYVPIRAEDFVSGHIDVPAGKTPVVLTFDDSSREQFSYLPDGTIDPKTALGILLRFSAKHPAFPATGTFFVIRYPWGGAPNGSQMFGNLFERGFELGNHTLDHVNLGQLSPDEVQREIVLGQRLITDAAPSAQVRTLALPYGIYPSPHELAIKGSWDDQSYHYQGVFEVGAGPAPSPYGTAFDPLAIPRIRASPSRKEKDRSSGYWLRYLLLNPDQRYISDGDPSTVTVPKVLAGGVAPKYRGRVRTY